MIPLYDVVQASSETDKEDLRQAVEKLKNDGIDMKLEIQSLRNIEKILKVTALPDSIFQYNTTSGNFLFCTWALFISLRICLCK